MSHRRTPLLIMATTFLTMSFAQADGALVSSWVRMDAYSSTKTLDERHGAGSVELGLKSVRDLSASDKLRFEGKLIQDVRDKHLVGRLVDGHWQHRGDAIDLRLGQQKITWGKADGINPTDFFTPHDYTVLQPFEADQRRSVPALRMDVATGDTQSLSFVAVPAFTAERQPLPHGTAVTERKPDGWREPQLGLRWSSTGDIDWSVSAFHGFLNTPLWSHDTAGTVHGGGLFHHYARLDALGADVARNFGRWGFRAEAAWLEPKAFDGRQGLHPHAFLVAGADRGDADWNVNLQLLVRHAPGWKAQAPNDPLEAIAAQQNAINFGQLRRTQLGLTTRLSANWLNETLKAELLVVHYFRPGNTFLRPLLTYALSDTDSVAVGGEYDQGPDASFFGQLKRNRTAFAEYQHFF